VIAVSHAERTAAMPEARLQRTRETLPDGYQFGDAQFPNLLRWYPKWMREMDDRIARQVYREVFSEGMTRAREE
jgi:hypothetical protein